MPLALDLPKDEPVDRVRAGVLRIAPELIGDLLRLPQGNRAISARIGFDGSIELLIEGVDMPSRPPGEEAERVTLIVNLQTREESNARRQTLHWAHAPEKTWLLRDWE